MHILVTGAAGFLGNKVARQLLENGTMTGPSGEPEKITRVTLCDTVKPSGWADPRVETVVGDISEPATVSAALTADVQCIFHLAAVVSGHAEADFDLGMKINFDATRQLLERARTLGSCPRIVFSSSVAVFGGELPAKVPDTMATMPQSSYGAQKAMCELLVNDYSRKGFVDGRVTRLPTISVRPGAPNKAASSFASGIIREPLNGRQAVCPVGGDTRMWLMSPRQAVRNLLHAGTLDASQFGASRTVSLPGLSVRVSDMVDALQEVAGAEAVRRIEWCEDEAVRRIVNSWPGDFDARRAVALGFTADKNFADVIRAYMQDELGR
jgi:nucleoside-diphosphate-sugar epimerase